MNNEIDFLKASDGTGEAVRAVVTGTRIATATTLEVDSLNNWPTKFVATVGTLNVTTGVLEIGTITIFKGHISGGDIIIDQFAPGYPDNGNSIGQVVMLKPNTFWADTLAAVLEVSHDDDGTLKGSAVRAALGETASTGAGWTAMGETVSSVTNNGNRSYDITFASTVASLLSPGMRLRTTRTVTAPTQCADLEASSSQYFNDTSVSGITFTDDFTCGAWVKLESYTTGAIISRYNGTSGWILQVLSDGTVVFRGYNGGGANFSGVSTYQSIPLGKWVHIAAQLDMSAFTATTTTSYIMIDGVDVPAVVGRGGTNPTALVQAGNLEVGSFNAGTFFDGKLAQVFVSSAKITQANVRALMSKGLTTADTATYSLASAYSLNGVITDLNTTSANNLTAQGGALATATDSPFGQDSNGVTAGTTDYALVMRVSTTTATVQVPEGCTIPTSGGVSAVAYSTATSPFGFTLDKGRWEVGIYIGSSVSSIGVATNTTYAFGSAGQEVRLTLPVGVWSKLKSDIGFSSTPSATTVDVFFGISTSTSAFTNDLLRLQSRAIVAQASSSNPLLLPLNRSTLISITSVTSVYPLIRTTTACSAMTLRGTISTTVPEFSAITAEPAGI
jgi:hypothetical protein